MMAGGDTMSRSARLFEVIQLLRSSSRPVLAREIAEWLEISVRTVYRDIAALQAMQTPILGEPGVGYVMRSGYDLPAINFDVEEAEALSVGLGLIARTGDMGLCRAAKRASRKLHETAPGTRRLVTSSWRIGYAPMVELSEVRKAIRTEQKVRIRYRDVAGRETQRVIWPLVLIYYLDAVMLAAWCELRQDLRHFRLDRTDHLRVLPDRFEGKSDALISRWELDQKAKTVPTLEGSHAQGTLKN
ncbi:YafY family protein [Cognatiyoonia sp. IB215182]|uniref:helix-turn-helix transcriptional regulator n=1 Tax=Cognatiyoonia sp. IB215182 TaxID=3097353 RepID=UPI002A12FB06|nr:YafY family protein [Cognatiyoonia sp. IB215182]MDX8355850.1 YafY family protein [Cognatiyoonia sp. IB215182]